MSPRRLVLLLLAAATAAGAALLLPAPDDRAAGAPRGRLVVATTTQAADLARHVAGPRARVVSLLSPNTDPHEHELRPSDLEALAGASVVVRSGGEVDGWLGSALDGAGTDAPVLTLLRARGVRTAPGDPHWWQDPRNAIAAVAAIRTALSASDPAGARTYAARARAYTARLQALDRAVAACLDAIPRARRTIVTTHDALAAYARRYGVTVLGAVIPSRSTRGEPSAGQVDALVATIRRAGARAVFAEHGVASSVERAIAREAGATVGAPLYADALGPPGSPGATYVGSIAANTRALASGMTAGRARCTLPAR